MYVQNSIKACLSFKKKTIDIYRMRILLSTNIHEHRRSPQRYLGTSSAGPCGLRLTHVLFRKP